MQLKSIELSGFKSFPKKSVFEFNSPISAIVGPNGSGKSNVAEAFRFVLGEQSIKSLRGKKGEDLIWNGAGDSPRANRAAVKVTFDNRKKLFSLDFDEVIIERVVHRDGVNDYLINASPVRLRDIIELLANAHIGASGHHIISQGEADSILNANSKDRRIILEDALGLKIYQYKRQESERKLEKTLENIEQVSVLRKEIAPHLKFLKKQVEKVQKVTELKSELINLGKEYLKRESLFIGESKKEVNNQKIPLEKRRKELENELHKAQKVLESKGADEKSGELISLGEEINTLRKEKEISLQELGKIQGEISSEERILKKQREVENGSSKLVPIKELEDFGVQIEVKISEAENSPDLVFARKVIAEIRALFRGFLNGQKNRGVLLVRSSEDLIQKLEGQKLEITNKLQSVKEREGILQKQYSNLQKEIEKEKDSNRDAEKVMFRIMSEQSRVSSSLGSLRQKLEVVTHLETDFKRELEECVLLGGREVLDYESMRLQDKVDLSAKISAETLEEISAEERNFQEERRRKIEKIKIRLEDAGVSGSAEMIKEYDEVSERDSFLARELEDLEKSAKTLSTLIAELGEKLDVEFKSGIEKINKQFQDFFTLMFGGGRAELKVVKERKEISNEDENLNNILDEEGLPAITSSVDADEVTAGIEIEVSLPRKKIKGLAMLSGGERALTSIALLFAMSQVNPPPFIVLDETDAALDEANSKKYGDMIENLSKHSQLILITHNRETMSRAGIIYGVTMGTGGSSKMLSIQFEEAVAVAK